jgi:hypothetical protein
VEGKDFLYSIVTVDKSGSITLVWKLNSRSWNCMTNRPRKRSRKRRPQAVRQQDLSFGMLNVANWSSFATRRNHHYCSLPSDAPGFSSSTARRTSGEEKVILRHDNVRSHIVRLCMKRIQKKGRTSAPAILESESITIGLPSARVRKGSDARPGLCDH